MSTLLVCGSLLITLSLPNSSEVTQSASPKSVTMQDLTVPKDRLPDGCSLKVIDPARQEVMVISGPGRLPARSTANPWTGTDRHVLAELRQRVDGYGPLRLPDGPPLTSSEASAMFLQFADGVEEGYAATYTQSGGRDLGVWAVRLAPASARSRDFPDRQSQNARVVEIGLIRAALFGDSGACSTAIATYLKSLAK